MTGAMPWKSVLPIVAVLAALPILPAAAQQHPDFPVNPASPSTARQNVFVPPPQPAGDQQVCLLDKPTHRLICHTYDEWRALGIVQSAKRNLEAPTMK